jgi:hypothetical protein
MSKVARICSYKSFEIFFSHFYFDVEAIIPLTCCNADVGGRDTSPGIRASGEQSHKIWTIVAYSPLVCTEMPRCSMKA